MRGIEIVIPTRGRLEKLQRTLASIQRPDPEVCGLSVIIVSDGEVADFHALKAHCPVWLTTTSLPRHVGAVAARNEVCPMVRDGLLWATDDVEFAPGLFAHLIEQFNRTFPDDDGVIGIRQDHPHHPTGVGLMGSAFLSRYPGRRPFFPHYWHFAAQEIGELATKLGKYADSEVIGIAHRAPYNTGEPEDQTHRDARMRKVEDHSLWNERKTQGLVWGSEQ